jgi:DNA mismatch repair protein MutL
MPNIKVLPKEISELIAAGEVVERPASVIKELVENSIDAGATAITVEIEHGGVTYMRVTDNGCGIAKEQIKTAFLRHATSKIKTASDLDAILTLGFRGEALASICAVSRVEIMSAVEGENGVCYEISGGEEVSFEEIGCPKGTTIIVRDLFFNVPARMKFLKKDVTEGNAVASIMDRIALSHPDVAVKFIRDGKTTLNTTGDGKLKSTVYAVLGRDFSSSLIPVEYAEEGLSL